VRFSSILSLLLPAAVVAAACSATPSPVGTGGAGAGTATGGGGSAVAATLVIQPADAVLDVQQGQPATLTYKALLTTPDSMTDVTATTGFSVDDPSLGKFDSGSTFTAAGMPGKLKVHATSQGLSADTTLTIKTETIVVTQGAPPDAPGKFGGTADSGKSPQFVYPADGTLVPPNMNVLEFQFYPGAGNDLFELTFSTASVDVKVYLTCTPVGAGCAYTPDDAVWKLVAEAGRGADPVVYTLRGVSTAQPATVGVSAPQKISFGKEDMVGGLYYWNAAAGSTMRYEFGKSGQQAELYMNAATAGAGICVGCHVLSRDGTRIVEGFDIPGPSAYKVFDVATKMMVFGEPGLFSGQGANFFSFSPDSAQILASDGNTIVLRDATSGNAVTSPLVANGAMPDWSPDGKRIVYAKGTPLPAGVSQPGVDKASLEILSFDGSMWQPGPTLVPFGGKNNYYPSFSPDGGWVVFNQSVGNSYDAKDATVWAVSAAGGTPVKLATASTGGDSWPKWAPVAQQYKSGQLLWLTFSSRRQYGLRLPAGQTAQIWMTAFDPALAAQGKDPSYPAFWLPFQDMASGNHIAQWVLKVERKPCSTTGDCDPNEQCQGGTCEPVPK
jgi:hypothetical protein